MELICQICNKKFESENTRQKICDDPECTRIRSRQYYLKWKEAHPTEYQKHRQAQAKMCRKERTALKYDDIIIPKAVKKRRCTVKGCRRITANGGQNYFLCDYHWHQLSKDCSSEYPEFIYEDSNFEDIHSDYSAAVDKHFWDLV